MNPKNMTRVIVQIGQFVDFAFYKDGLYKIGKDYYKPSQIKNWASISQLKQFLTKPQRPKKKNYEN